VMDEQKARDILSGASSGVAACAARWGLWLASKPYAAGMRLRRWAYRRGVFGSRAAAVPVICVGNLTTGGTGKTPMVAWVVERLKQAGHSPAILTRGYKGVPGEAGSGGGSDEARLLEALTGVAVVVDADRVAGASRAVAGGADVLVMDDGFQHRRLRRDLDVVLVDAVEPFGFGHCLPRGLLREAPSALADAGAVVLTHADEAPPEIVEWLTEHLGSLAGGAPVHSAIHRPMGLIDESGSARPLEELRGRRVYAFCGLASPEHFFAALSRLGAHVTGRRALADHAVYTPRILAELADAARDAEAKVLVTTQKDHVKLAGIDLPGCVWQLAMTIDVTGGAEELTRQIVQAAGGAVSSPRT